MKKLVAITGGIGSGKSLALQFLRELNYPVFSCDEIYKEVIVSKEYIELLEKSFPNVVKNGQVDRTALAETVFNNEIMRIKLFGASDYYEVAFKVYGGSRREHCICRSPIAF